VKGSDAPQIYHITADIDRVETSITIAGRRIAVRAAALLIVGLLGSFALASLLLPPLGPLFAVPIGLTPLYLAALLAFVRTPDGRHWEAMIVDRYRFSRMAKLAVNLSEGVELEQSNKIINLREEVIPVVDTTTDTEPIRRTLHEIDLPVTIEAEASGLRMQIDDKVLIIQHDVPRNRLRVTVEKRRAEDS
jgi:hypothetical protein